MSFRAGGEQRVEADSLVIQDVKPGDNTLYGAVGAVALRDVDPIAVVITDTASSPVPETGFYVYMYSDGSSWVSSVEFSETIHKIGQKYLPGVEVFFDDYCFEIGDMVMDALIRIAFRNKINQTCLHMNSCSAGILTLFAVLIVVITVIIHRLIIPSSIIVVR